MRGIENGEFEWTGKLEIRAREIDGSKQSMHGNILTNSRIQRDRFDRSMFSAVGTLLSASAVPQCDRDIKEVHGVQKGTYDDCRCFVHPVASILIHEIFKLVFGRKTKEVTHYKIPLLLVRQSM